MIEVKTENYKHYGKVVALSNGAIELKVTVDVGPRVIYCALNGGENVMLNHPDTDDGKRDERYEAAFGKGKRWHIYGGHRIWFSPEDFPLSYNPDDEPVDYRQEGDKFIFTQKKQRTTELQVVMEITLDKKKPVVTVNNILTNLSGGIRYIAPWALTVLAPGGLEIIPQPKEQYDLLSNREIVLWPYSNMADSRVCWGKDFITLRSVAGTPDGSFKLGLNNTAGVAAYVNNGTAFVKHYNHEMKGNYPDRGVSFETYTNDTFIEIESLGTMKELMPGEATAHQEVWKLFKVGRVPSVKNEAGLEKLTGRLFK